MADQVDLAFRLTNSDAARRVLMDAHGATLALIISDVLYTSVVASGGPYIEHEQYRKLHVTGRSVDTDAWAYIPRLGAPPVSAERTVADSTHQGPNGERREIKTEVYNEIGSVETTTAIFGIQNDNGRGRRS